MDTYLVGGAVRDRLLGKPVQDRDWVVVGATPQAMLARGFKQVGADFPVFLHPDTHEEYALARTERKQGHGYHGFTVYSAPDVTLEEDLKRRDLTINAMAQADDGTLVDPFGGCGDLERRILRHVSPAFSEDPLRILRLARFAARFAPLGFTVADETRDLMAAMVAGGEVDHLVPERIWQETRRALHENSPRVYFEILRRCGALAVLMPELDAIFGVTQQQDRHRSTDADPESDAGEHALQCLTQAGLISDATAVRFAALTHDLGNALKSEDRGRRPIQALCERLKVPNDCRELALMASELHPLVHQALTLDPSAIVDLLDRADAWRRPDRFEQLLQVCEAARRHPDLENRPYLQARYLRCALAAAQRVQAKEFLEQGISGKALGEAIRRGRRNEIAGVARQAGDLEPPDAV